MTAADAAALRAHVEALDTVDELGGIGDVLITRTERGIRIEHFARRTAVSMDVVEFADAERLGFAVEPDADGEQFGVLTIRAENGVLRYRVLGADHSDNVLCELVQQQPAVGGSVIAAQLIERGVRCILVIAFNYQHFGSWCYEHESSPRDRRVRLLAGPQDFRGFARQQPYVVLEWPERFGLGMRPHEVTAMLQGYGALEITEADASAWLTATTPPTTPRIYRTA